MLLRKTHTTWLKYHFGWIDMKLRQIHAPIEPIRFSCIPALMNEALWQFLSTTDQVIQHTNLSQLVITLVTSMFKFTKHTHYVYIKLKYLIYINFLKDLFPPETEAGGSTPSGRAIFKYKLVNATTFFNKKVR